MRSFSIPMACSVLLLCTSCSHFYRNANTTISISEENNVYKMTANFDANKTKAYRNILVNAWTGIAIYRF